MKKLASGRGELKHLQVPVELTTIIKPVKERGETSTGFCLN